MGTLLGHVVPGTFFTLFAVWWGFSIATKHYRARKYRKSYVFQTSTTFECSCCPSYKNKPMESYIKLFCSVVGMVGEFVTGFEHSYNETLKRDVLIFGPNNAQHITMFLGFGIASVFEIFVHHKYPLPNGIEFFSNIIAYGIQAFLFHFHLHGRNEVDIHVHTLLVYAIMFCMFASIWEFSRPNEILATYARIAGTMLQGLWFFSVGFILYFPSDDPYWTWTPTHGHIMIITVIFTWIALGICMFLFLQSSIVWYLLKQRHADNDNDMFDKRMGTNDFLYTNNSGDDEDDDDNDG